MGLSLYNSVGFEYNPKVAVLLRSNVHMMKRVQKVPIDIPKLKDVKMQAAKCSSNGGGSGE